MSKYIMSGAPELPHDVLELIRRAKKELPGEFVAYPLDSGLSIEEFRAYLVKRLEENKIDKKRQDRFTWTPADIKVQDGKGNWIRGDEFLK